MGKDYDISDHIIKRLMETMVSAVSYGSLARNIVDVFGELFGAELCTLWRRVQQDGEDRLALSASLGFEPKPGQTVPTYTVPADAEVSNEEIEGVTAWVAARKETCLANSYTELSQDPSKPWYGAHRGTWDSYQFAGQAHERFKCLLGVPIVYEGPGETEEALIGVLKLESKPGGFSEHDKELTQHLAPFVAIALETMAIRERHEQNRQRVTRDLTRALLSGDPTTFYQLLVKKTADLLGADVCSLWLVNGEGNKLELGANYGVVMTELPPDYPLNWEAEDDREINGLTAWVVIRNRPFFGQRHEDLSSHPAWKGKWDREQWDDNAPARFGCLYAVPLRDSKNEPFGVLKIENRAKKPKFDSVDRATFDLMADFIALAIELNSRLRSDVVYDFFHLLKQPIGNAVMTFSDLRRELSRPESRPERIQSRMAMLARNLDSIRVWVTNVYGLAAPMAGPADEPRAKSILDLLSNIVNEIQKLFPDFVCDLEAVDDITLALTPLQVKKVDAILFNILNNSYKYSVDPRDIRAEVKREEKGVRLKISDNGKGIAPEDLPRIFDPYFTRGMDRWPDSMGLGLATVNRLLKELGWEREVTSQVGEGTNFHILIPRGYVR